MRPTRYLRIWSAVEEFTNYGFVKTTVAWPCKRQGMPATTGNFTEQLWLTELKLAVFARFRRKSDFL
jgi:hypothetical protein